MKRTTLVAIIAYLLGATVAIAADHATAGTQVSELLQYRAHHHWCGRAIAPERWNHGVVTRRFQRCRIEGRFRAIPYAHATTATPTTPPASATPFPTIPVPTPTIGRQNYENYVAGLINQSRTQFGVAPLAENATQDGCSRQHSIHMAEVGAISHDQFPSDVCIAYSTAGENVGMGGGGDVDGQLLQLHQLMMSEGVPFVGCTGSHACNIVSPSYRQVGVGVYVDASGRAWLTTDFTN